MREPLIDQEERGIQCHRAAQNSERKARIFPRESLPREEIATGPWLASRMKSFIFDG
jgi:hypothetical protein